IKEASQQRLEEFGETECTYRILLPEGIRWIHDRLKITRNEKGITLRLEGMATDVTSLKLIDKEKTRQEQLANQYRDNLEISFNNSSDNVVLLDAEVR